MSSESKKMGVVQLTIITAVNMMGSGIIMLPAKLAQVGTISILSWLITATGSMALAFCFAQCGMYSKLKGGMGGYAQNFMGVSGNFLVNYTYGFSLIIANVAIAISAVGYGAVFLGKTLDPVTTGLSVIALLWICTVANFGGPKVTGQIGSVTVWGVIIPVVGISILGWIWFSPSLYAAMWNPHNLPFADAVTSSITLTLWSFLGLESACANTDAVENPEKNVPIAVMGGTLGAAIIYIASTNVMQGIVPGQEIVASTAPFGLVVAHMFGGAAGKAVEGMMTLACIGSLLGWQFTTAQVLKTSADVGYFPAIFSKVTEKDAPIPGMIIMTIIQTIISFATMSDKLIEQFEAIVNLATITNLVPYIICMAVVPFLIRGHVTGGKRTMVIFLNLIAGAYSFYACYASGVEALAYGALVTFFGWTIYGFVAHKFEKPVA